MAPCGESENPDPSLAGSPCRSARVTFKRAGERRQVCSAARHPPGGLWAACPAQRPPGASRNRWLPALALNLLLCLKLAPNQRRIRQF